MMYECFSKYTVKKGDTLWDLSRQFLGSPTEWWRIWALNNLTSVRKFTGKGIDNPDLIYTGQSILIPKTFRKPAGWHAHPVSAAQAGQPGKLNDVAMKISIPVVVRRDFISARPRAAGSGEAPVHTPQFKGEFMNVPVSVIKGPGYTATLNYSGEVLIQLAHRVPLKILTTGMEFANQSRVDDVRDLLVSETKVKWDGLSDNVSFSCNMVAASIAPGAPIIKSGWVASAAKPVPVLRTEIIYRNLSGTFQGNGFYAVDFKVIIEIEPDLPRDRPRPMPEVGAEKHRHLSHGFSSSPAAKTVGTVGILGMAAYAARELGNMIYTFLFAASEAAGSVVLPFVVIPPGVLGNQSSTPQA